MNELIEMPTIKIGFADTFGTAIDFFTWVLNMRYNVIVDNNNPDYLIFGDGNFGQEHKKFANHPCKKIFYTGENVRPPWHECDVAFTFDHENSSRHYRLPLYVLEMHAMMKEGYKYSYLLFHKAIDVEKVYSEKKGFCSFVQSNPNVQERNTFFQFLNDKKKVDSAGPWMNNVGYVLPRPGGHGDKLTFIKDYKFNIAFENGSYPGYVTEKLLNCFYANTIPIYWGSSTVDRDFNSKAFINTMSYSQNEVWEIIRELDNNKKLYLDMLSQPAFENNQANEYTYISNLLDWWKEFV